MRGLISPLDFIPLAEEIGLMGMIGDWVLNQACADAVAWPEDVKVAVNLSPLQFRNHALAADVAAALARSGLPARRLDVEITESVLLHDSEAVLAILHQIKSLGVRVSMDDFGPGFSSLSLRPPCTGAALAKMSRNTRLAWSLTSTLCR